MIGQTISHYRILEKLGEGGMGVVYKAHDDKLDRIVALKFLSSRLDSPDQDKARFMQEARAAATLNHPNICTIHDIQEHDGHLFIVMEFVDGQTLRAKGQLSLKQSLDVGIQVAEGLAAAHDKGIVHRDIKPENIMVRKDGICQIMDFGLAKLRTSSSQINRLTKEGSTVGTAGYMSPEQVLGQDADHRSDIFSFGVLLYELFTGELPFRGVHETALSYEIVNVDAAPMSTLKSEIDQNLDSIVLDCLEKDPKERCQSVAEVARDLRRVKRESTRQRHSRITAARPAYQPSGVQPASSSVLEAVPSLPVSAPATRSMPGWIVTAAIALLMFAAGFGISLLRHTPSADLPLIRATIEMPRGYRYADNIGGHSVLSPDGSMVAFVAIDSQARGTIWVRKLNSGDGQPLAGTDGAQYPFWSPDNRSIGFFADGKVRTADVAGGAVLTLADAPFGRGAVWTTSGKIIFSPNLADPALYEVPASGGTVRSVIAFDTSLHAVPRYPEMLPDGRHLLVALLGVVANDANIYLAALDGSAPVKLLEDAAYPRYAAGHLFFVRQGILMVQRFDPASLSVAGSPAAIHDHINLWTARAKADYSVTEGGLLMYCLGGTTGAGELLWMTPDGSEESLGQFELTPTARLSPDAARIAYEVGDQKALRAEIWTYELVSKVRTKLTFGQSDRTPVWSADGKMVYFNREVGANKAYIYAKKSDGSGNDELIASGDEGTKVGYYPMDASPDGKFLLVTIRNESGGELGVIDISSSARPAPVKSLGIKAAGGKFSPDGRWIVARSVEGSSSRLNVISFQGRTGMWQIAPDIEDEYWESNQISFFSRPRDRYESVEVSLTSGSPVFGSPRPLFKAKSQSMFMLGVSQKGNRYLLYRPGNAGGTNLSLVVNWKKLVESAEH